MCFIDCQHEDCTVPTLTGVASSKFWGGMPPAGWTYCSNPTASTNDERGSGPRPVPQDLEDLLVAIVARHRQRCEP
jgi:hypothetical protein